MKEGEKLFPNLEELLSASTQENPLASAPGNTAQGYTPRCFPPIHSTHYNNKSLYFIF
jgi:hypothetical protein